MSTDNEQTDETETLDPVAAYRRALESSGNGTRLPGDRPDDDALAEYRGTAPLSGNRL